MALSFGVTVLPDPPSSRFLELLQHAESNGFEYGWTYDSHVLWQESFPLLTMAVQATTTMKFGHCVTNPGTREPTVLASGYATLHDISNGRMVMGIGRGDSAVRYIGDKPVRVAEFERRCAMIKEFMNGREVEWNEKPLKLAWVRPELPEIPMWVAGYGPKALAVAGRVGDGVIIQLADPVIIQWIMATAREAAAEAGRDPAALKCIVCAPSHITDDIADARDQVRWFPAMVSNHVMDLIERYGFESEIPHELTEYVRVRKFYDYDEHSRVGAKHGEFVTDEICDRFCVLGNAEQATAKLKELEAIGVDQFNIYLMTHGQEEDLAAYGKDIIPAVWLDDRRAERARNELDGRRCGGVLAVEDRVHLDDLERAREAGLGHELHGEVRFAVGEPSANRRADTRRDLGIEHVHVEGDMHEPTTCDPVERLADRAFDADAVDLAHREDPYAGVAKQSPLPVVEEPRPDEGYPLRIDCGQRPDLALESRSCEAECGGKSHPVHVPARARRRRVDVRVRVDPEHATLPVHRRETSERPERNRVVAAEDQRQRATRCHLGHARRDQLARVVDLGKEARSFVPDRGRLRHGRLDVPLVAHRVPETDEALLEPRVPDRRRPHVDAPSPLPEVERGTDDRDLALGAHGAEPSDAAANCIVMARAGIEPATPRFSAVCSTD